MNVIEGYQVEIIPHPEIGMIPQFQAGESWDSHLMQRREWLRKADRVEQAEPDMWYMGMGVRVNGRPCKFLTAASRYVYVDEVNDLVVKVATHISHMQTWREYFMYHEVLDDEARALVPEILGIGACRVDGRVLTYTLMRRVDFVTHTHAEYGTYVSAPMHRWREQVARVLRDKYHLRDLHDGNLSFTKDGRVCLVDLGVAEGVRDMIPRSPQVRSVGQNLPDWARTAMEVTL